MRASGKDIRRELSKDDELDYLGLASDLGPDAIPALRDLVRDEVPRIAASAAYLAGLIAAPASREVVEEAVESRDAVVRVAAAATLPMLAGRDVAPVAVKLLQDDDVGVRARAVRAATWFDDEAVVARVRVIAAEDRVPALRELAARILERLPGATAS
jgi:HEAT repeat protein